jgi:hypothetical protein
MDSNNKALKFDMTEFEFKKIINKSIKNEKHRKYLYAQVRQKKIIFLK